MNDPEPTGTRRDILKGFRAHSSPASGAADSERKRTDASSQDSVSRTPPSGGSTVRLTTRAMACDFSVIMNPGPSERIDPAGEVLELIHAIEGWLSIYRDSSEISLVNRTAFQSPVCVRPALFELLKLAAAATAATHGAFDIACGALNQIWKSCRREMRIPTQIEIDAALARSGSNGLILDESHLTVQFGIEGLALDPGAIGKGYALDESARWLKQSETAPREFLLHGGHSSLLAVGEHNGHEGWPVGIGNPLFTNQRLGTILLRNQAMATSGSNIQFFRHEGRRYGHILNPRTGWPIEGMLSVTVLAASAAMADALSTAFFVSGVEKARQCCENLPGVGAILIPFPDRENRVRPEVIGIPAEQIFWEEGQRPPENELRV